MSPQKEKKVEKIKNLAQKNGGMITTAQIESCGISRAMIPSLIGDGLLTKEAHGIYCYSGELPDEMQILQQRSPKLIFSYGTALFLWDMSDRIPHLWDITVPQGFNASLIKRDNPHIRLHYISADKWKVGITQANTPEGNPVRLYNKERCIIDLVKRRDKIDRQLYLQAMREYFSSRDTDRNRLLEYARIFRVERSIREYSELLSS